MMSKSFFVYFSVALLAITLLWASKAAAAPNPYCPMVKLGSKDMKNLGACTNACKKTFGGNANAVCLKKKKLEFNPEGLKLAVGTVALSKELKAKSALRRLFKLPIPPMMVTSTVPVPT
ncbi:hypothetical protein ACP275_01G102500 [Erythranthe tilingii]